MASSTSSCSPRPPSTAYSEAAADLGIPFELVERLFLAFGVPQPLPNEQAREDDEAILRGPKAFLGAIDEADVLDSARLFGDALPAARRVSSPPLPHARRGTVQEGLHGEDDLERASIRRGAAADPPAIVFLDISGYTRLTEELGDEASAAMPMRLANLVQEAAAQYSGRTLKWIGDGVELYFRRPVINAGTLVYENGDFMDGRSISPRGSPPTPNKGKSS